LICKHLYLRYDFNKDDFITPEDAELILSYSDFSRKPINNEVEELMASSKIKVVSHAERVEDKK